MNILDIIIVAVIAILMWLAGRKIYQVKKNGVSSCGAGCSGSCASCSSYHAKTSEVSEKELKRIRHSIRKREEALRK